MITSLYVRARTWADSDEGATATEYGILVAFIAFLIIVGVAAFGGALGGWFDTLSTSVGGWNATNPTP